MTSNSVVSRFITIGSMLAMLFGVAAGIIGKKLQLSGLMNLAPYFELFGKLWVVLLLILILPLAGSYILYVFISITNTKEIGKLGGRSILLHTVILFIGVSIGYGFGYLAIRLLADKIPLFTDVAGATEILDRLNAGGSYSFESIKTMLVQLQLLLGKVVIVFIFFAIITALIVGKTRGKFKAYIFKKSELISKSSFSFFEFFLLSLPLAVFCLLFAFSFKEGVYTVGAAGYLIAILCVLLIIFIAVQYIIVAVWGNVGLGKFFRAMLPSQLMAMSSRSSLATMPALLECAENRIGLNKSVSAVIIPFFVSTFRVNYAISTTFGLIFLAHVFQVDLDIVTIVIFTLVQLLVSFGSPGIPSGGHYFNVSIYIAAGIPVEGVLLMKAIDQIPDIFKTLLNVTEVMTVTTVVAGKKTLDVHEIEA